MRTAFGESFDVPVGYLNTASSGIPPVAATRAVIDRVRRWSAGGERDAAHVPEADDARAAFGRLVGVPHDRVALGATVSQLVAGIATGLPDDASVVVAEGDFTSLTAPLAARGLRITEVPLVDVADAAPGHDLVAVSVAQSADGRLVDLDGLRTCGVPVLLDASQAVGWLPLSAAWADYVVAVGYKFLLAPKGTAWLAMSEAALARGVPVTANWFAGEDRRASMYGLPVGLASSARRFDITPAPFAQTGAAVTLPWLAALDREAVRDHVVGLADRLRAGLGLGPGGTAIVSVPASAERLAAAGVTSSARAGRVRLSFHLYNTVEDVDLVLEALT
ncbi:aminotransferase class V-fold PLP-dependent enzyme [Saccharothrix violaceirubra]|uniref:Selenocysteine lyase/cysteine desulfurase n=1 Tax=Saccharothrix violaceirubra TaxID=413306 RepID=A0A7W7T043_9PSEU|nr:aminotransferase class V-fold PLP-dependent enzyme [Saccharothrix violaceirubra]MBB4964030.1 selenocysteine lyase/cysteine desulfurase [Saccharothrix violaceirubra]